MQEPSQKSLPRQPPLHLTRAQRAAISGSVNASLLRCHATLQFAGSSSIPSTPSSGPDQDRRDIYLAALRHADDALATALAFHAHKARARAYLFRGHCLVRLGEWERAHAAYWRSTRQGDKENSIKGDDNEWARGNDPGERVPGVATRPGNNQRQRTTMEKRHKFYGCILSEDGPSLIRLQDGRTITVSPKRPVLRRVAAVLEMEQETITNPHDALCLGVWAAMKRGPQNM
ncbi:hypothetical protein ACRALDRAFT_1069203 [Sodiomyces alcalophilus JCM 7366]|uniref:uncharacterized protein n=1 Tax=Sodiomyces alcalophilus JCM 7366 TaxID=591952 RepID=UPI0039B54C11